MKAVENSNSSSFSLCGPDSVYFTQLQNYFATPLYEIQAACKSGSIELWVITESQKMIGYALRSKIQSLAECSLRIGDATTANQIWKGDPLHEVQYHIASNKRGQGIGSKYIVPWLQEQKANCPVGSLFAQVTSNNERSKCLLQKAGFTFYSRFIGGEDISIYL